MKPRLGIAITVALLLVLAWAGPAWADPQRLAAEPEPGSELHEPPREVKLTFSEPLDASSEIRVYDECDNRLDDGDTQVQLNEMRIDLALEPSGVYRVFYLAVGLSGSASGAYEFTVLHGGPSCDGSAGHHHGGDESHQGGGHEDHESGQNGGHHERHAGTAGHAGVHSSSAEHTHTEHSAEAHSAHDSHDGDHEDHEHSQSKPDASKGRANLAVNRPAGLPAAQDLTVPVVALGLAALVGAVGGWVLRSYAPMY